MTLNKNDTITLTITDFTEAGLGVGKADGFPVFVTDAVIGDTVRAHITKVKKNYAYARTDAILQPSKDRTEAPCPSFQQCGSCQLLHYAYAAQLRYKEKKVHDALVRIGGFADSLVEEVLRPVAGMEDPLRYRNKAQYPVAQAVRDDAGDGRLQTVCGFYAPRSHRVVPVEDCLIGAGENKRILRAVKESMQLADVHAYNEEDGTGHVRHVLIRKAFATGQIMVCLVVNAKEALSRFRDVLILQLTELQGVTSICFNYNERRDNVIMGDVTETIYGKPYIEDILCDLRFRISAPSFYQVNPVMTKTLYETVRDFAFDTLPESITQPVLWDLYCGIGTISLVLARELESRYASTSPESGESAERFRVYGVEAVPEAVADAKENAKLNGLEQVSFTEGLAEGALQALPHPDVVVLDPPRKGCDGELLKTLLKTLPERIVYVSCDPATLARDLKILCEGGAYRIRAVQPCDMFPMTVHCEAVVSLSRAGQVQ